MNAHRALAVIAAVAAGLVLSACSSTVSGSPAASNAAGRLPLGAHSASPVTPAAERGVTDAPSASVPSTPAPSASVPTPRTPTQVPAATTSDPAPAPATASAPVPQGQPSIATFVGTWYGHGRSLVVRQDGTVVFDFRTYRDCSATVTTACDRTSGDEIIDGGHVVGWITYVKNDTTVTVTVRSSSDPQDFPVAPFRLGFDRRHDAVAPFTGQFDGVPFCGDRAPAGYCGA